MKSLVDFRNELNRLLSEYPNEQSRNAIRLIDPTLDQYQTFAQNFVSMMAHPVDTSMMWGLLFLIFKVKSQLPFSLIDTAPIGSESHLGTLIDRKNSLHWEALVP